MIGVRLGGFLAVMIRVRVVRVGEVRVMPGVFVLAIVMMLGRLAMMLGRLLVMVRGVLVMVGGALGVLHGSSPGYAPDSARRDYAGATRRSREGFMSSPS